VKEPELPLLLHFQIGPIATNRLQEAERADDIGLNKLFRPMNRAVYMTFRGKMDDGAWLVSLKQLGHKLMIVDISLYETVPVAAAD
jgi:hypothetical protein